MALSGASRLGGWVRLVAAPVLWVATLSTLAAYQNVLRFPAGNATIALVERGAGPLLQAGVWLSAAALVNRLVHILIWNGLAPRRLGVPVPRLVRDLCSTGVYFLALTAVVAVTFHQSVVGLWTGLGALGVVVGFALRSVILDFFVGIAINIERPFKIGDYVLLQQSSITGRVAEINWRTTRLETNDGNAVIVPNNRIGDMILTNFSSPDSRAEFELVFSLEYAVPAGRALRVLHAGVLAATGTSGILADPEPKARIKGISGLGVDYKVKYWVDCAKAGPGKARHAVLYSVLEHLHQAGISLAYNKQDIYYAPMPQRQFDGREKDDRIHLLSRVELFSTLPENELAMLAGQMRSHVVPAGEALITQGQAGSSMFILVEGLLHAFITFSSETTSNKLGQIKVGQIEPGDFLGEMSLLTGEPRIATVTAATEALVYEITSEQVQELFVRRPELVSELSQVIAERRLRNDAAYASASAEEQSSQKNDLAHQIFDRIRSFFRSSAVAVRS